MGERKGQVSRGGRCYPPAMRVLALAGAFALLVACGGPEAPPDARAAPEAASPVAGATAAALGRQGCDPPSPATGHPRFLEVQGSSDQPGDELWALVFGRLQTGRTIKIVWKVTGEGPFRAAAFHPKGTWLEPAWGPELHGSSNWERPGREWGAGFQFPLAGCWHVRVSAGSASGHFWFEVARP